MVYNRKVLITYYHPQLFEYGHMVFRPRVRAIVELARQMPTVSSVVASEFEEYVIALAHTPEYIYKLQKMYGLDGKPLWPGASWSVNSALASVIDSLQKNRISLALTSDGGHHASRASQWDMCYLNHAAIAALFAVQQYNQPVLIIDTDYHHGDGTLDIVKEHPLIDFVCIHCTDDVNREYSDYANCQDRAIAQNISPADYQHLLRSVLETLTKRYTLIIHDLGYDIHRLDYGGLANFTEKEIAAIVQIIVNYARNHANNRLSIQLAGGANPELAKMVYREIFDTIT